MNSSGAPSPWGPPAAPVVPSSDPSQVLSPEPPAIPPITPKPSSASRRRALFACIGVAVVVVVGGALILQRSRDSNGSADTASAHEAFAALAAQATLEPGESVLLDGDCPAVGLDTAIKSLPDAARFEGDTFDTTLRIRPILATDPEQFPCFRQSHEGSVLSVATGLAASGELADYLGRQIATEVTIETEDQTQLLGGDLIRFCVQADHEECGGIWSDGLVTITLLSSTVDSREADEWTALAVPALVEDLRSFQPADVTSMKQQSMEDIQRETCRIERLTIETAVEAFYAQFSTLPTGENDLVETQILRGPSTNFDLALDGTVVTAPSSNCQ